MGFPLRGVGGLGKLGRVGQVQVREVTALVVEDDELLLETLVSVVADHASTVLRARTVREAVEHLERAPLQLLLLDFALPDGTGLDVLRSAQAVNPSAVAIAVTGEARPEDGFELARFGVRAFVPKPSTLAQVRLAIETALALLPDPRPEVRAAVGRVPIADVEHGVREAMVREAMARTGGSITSAATLLGISRQRLQYILKTQLDC